MGWGGLVTVAGFDVYMKKSECPLLFWRLTLRLLHGSCKKADASSMWRKNFPYLTCSLIGQLIVHAVVAVEPFFL